MTEHGQDLRRLGVPLDDDGGVTFDLFERGRRFLDQRHPGQAALLLERALRRDPEKNSIREALARAYFALGRYESAADAFREVVRRAPTNDYAQFGLSRSLFELGDLDEARGAAKLAVAMAPDNDHYRRALAACLAAS